MLQKLRTNKEGFTLIELMIVIAIIGILAAIAIPNFISYRDKAFCSAAEHDAHAIGGGLADYFAVPSRTTWTAQGPGATEIDFDPSQPYDLSDENHAEVTESGGVITISVTDASGRCPTDYQDAVDGWNGSGVFTKTM